MGRTAHSSAAAVLLLLSFLLWTASVQKRAELLALGDALTRQEEEICWLKEERPPLPEADGVADLEETERQARELGMGRPRDDQLLYVYAALPDRAEVLSRETAPLLLRLRAAAEKIGHIFTDGRIGFE